MPEVFDYEQMREDCDFTHNFAATGTITLPSTTLEPLFLRQLILDEIDSLEP